MKDVKLNQVIAVEKAIKAKANAEIDTIYKAAQKPVLFEGFVKTYKKKSEEDEDHPDQKQKVQITADLALREASERLTKIFDVTAQKDWANCEAKADVEVDGEILVEGAPTTFLLFLEKQLTDLYTVVEKLPVLDAAENWSYDAAQGMFKTEPTLTHKTKKVQKPLVLYPATDKHPAQTQLITEDVTVGHWEQVRFSGAVAQPKKAALLQRVGKLQHAVKFAREKANLTLAPERAVGDKIMGWIFKS